MATTHAGQRRRFLITARTYRKCSMLQEHLTCSEYIASILGALRLSVLWTVHGCSNMRTQSNGYTQITLNMPGRDWWIMQSWATAYDRGARKIEVQNRELTAKVLDGHSPRRVDAQ